MKNLVFVMILTMLTLFPVAGKAADVAGRVVGLSGLCMAQGRPLKPGSSVRVGDTLDVPKGVNLKLAMVDRSVISFAPDTRVTVVNYVITRTDRRVELTLMHGLLRLEVSAIPGSSRFEVSTTYGTAAMRSAAGDWFVADDGGGAQVGTLTGDVTLTSAATQRSVSIPARWGTRLQTGLDPMLPRTWGQVEFGGFMRRTECCGPPNAPQPQVPAK